MSTTKSSDRHATLYRMVMPNHVCPFGLKSKWRLEHGGYAVDDHWLRTREEVDAFKTAHGVSTTPQTFIAGKRIGGNDDLTRFLKGKPQEKDATSYRPVIAVFAVALGLALAASAAAFGTPWTSHAAGWFVSFSMAILALLKLQDIERFSTSFLNYDLLARRWVPYAYIYPFAEGLAGVLMTAGLLSWLAVPIALFIGTVGALSVVKAVYIERRELICACVGGTGRVPLGALSLTENLFMVGMALWMMLA